MLLAVLSDVHANLPALEAVLADARRYRPDAYLFAGDLTGGPHTLETIDHLRSLPGWLIRGNGDTYMLRLWRGDAPPEWRTYRQFAFMRWSVGRLREEDLAFLASLSEEMSITPDGLGPVRLVHGSPGQPADGIYPQEDEDQIAHVLAAIDEPTLICGHTHEQWQAEVAGRLVLNPGAVCAPCDGAIGAQYALLEQRGGRWRAELKKVDYDIAALRRAFHTTGLLEEGGAFARAVVAGIETGVNVAMAFLQYAYGLLEARGLSGERFIPDEIWEVAARSFDWQRYERGAI